MVWKSTKQSVPVSAEAHDEQRETHTITPWVSMTGRWESTGELSVMLVQHGQEKTEGLANENTQRDGWHLGRVLKLEEEIRHQLTKRFIMNAVESGQPPTLYPPPMAQQKILSSLGIGRKDSISGPMASTDHGRALEDAATPRKVVQQGPGRGGQTHRPAGWKRRRPRPRLSHKGPMPF
ncbi:Apelin [Merluccius polli]|uniref:Apelin n=1 Tax=Merluccius polli TaxID=89951 RepID=A0AA47MZ85_MERPO|nr:Apelin [Merluccius polli]